MLPRNETLILGFMTKLEAMDPPISEKFYDFLSWEVLILRHKIWSTSYPTGHLSALSCLAIY